MSRLDPRESFEALKERVKEAIGSTFPHTGDTHILDVEDVEIVDQASSADHTTQKKAKMNGRTWGVPVNATLVLKDAKTGEVIERKKRKIATLPKITNRYSYIVGGSEFQVDGQWRLRPGVYTKVKANGELDSFFNIKGRPLHIGFDPGERRFKVQHGGAKPPLYPIMKAMGVSDDTLEKEWGKEILTANKLDTRGRPIKVEKTAIDFAKRLDPKAEIANYEQATAIIQENFKNSELHPEVTKRTLGKEIDHINADAMLRSSNRLLGVARGKESPDVRDSLMFKDFYGIEDFVSERLTGHKPAIERRIANNLDRKNKIDDIVGPDVFNRPIKEFFGKVSLASTPSQTNPLKLISSHMKTTIAGEGGVADANRITEEAKLVDPSHFGVLDPLHTPEGCFDDQTEVFTSSGWVPWPQVNEGTLFACLIDDCLEFHQAEAFQRYHYQGKMFGFRKLTMEYLVTPNHRMHVRPGYPGSSYRIEEAQDTHCSPRWFKGAHKPYFGEEQSTFKLPHVKGNNSSKNVDNVDLGDFAELIGWFLSEGYVYFEEDGASSSYRTNLFQSKRNELECQRIEALLDRLPFTWSSRERSGRNIYTLSTKQLASYMKSLGGKSYLKRLPPAVFHWPLHARMRLYEALLLGDGRLSRRHNEHKQFSYVYTTTSRELALGVERLIISLGYGATVKCYSDSREERYHDVYEIRQLLHEEHSWQASSHHRVSPYYTVEYDGEVFCATVPGSLLLVRRGGKYPLWLGNSSTGVSLQLALGARKQGNRVVIPLTNVKTGKVELVDTAEVHDSVVALPDSVKKVGGKYVPKEGTKVLASVAGNEMRPVSVDKVQYVVPKSSQMFSIASNMVPFINSDSPNRATMAGRHMEQAIPLAESEPPLVQSRLGTKTFDELVGGFASHRAPTEGKVVGVDADAITIQTKKRKKLKIPIYNNYPLNDKKGVIHSKPVVEVGDQLEKGQLIADTNYTEGGVYSPGRNLKVAYTPWAGLNFEDGVVISETAARKLTSEHMYKKGLSTRDATLEGKKKYQAYYPDRLNKERAEKLDDDGVVKVGQKVKPGDVVVAALAEQQLTTEQQKLRLLHKSLVRPKKDKALTWEEDYEGEVVEVNKQSNRVDVHIRTKEAMEVGDKLCYDEKTEVLTSRGWKPIAEVTVDDEVCCLDNGRIVYSNPTETFSYETGGDMYRIESQQLDLFVTLDHQMYVRRRNRENFELIPARDVIGKRVRYSKTGEWVGVDRPYFEFPELAVRAGQSGAGEQTLSSQRVCMNTFLALLGAFLADGNCPKSGNYGIELTKIKEPHRTELRVMLDEAGIRWTNAGGGNKTRIYSKQLLRYFRRFGRAHEKYIPEWVFTLPKERLEILFRWLFVWGAGYCKDGRPVNQQTVSRQLADDLQHLALHLGMAANIQVSHEAGEQRILGRQCSIRKTYDVRVITTKLTPQVNHGHTHQEATQTEEVIRGYQRPVYCLTVPSHVLYVRRNGKPVWSGNCGRHGNKGICLSSDHEVLTSRGWVPIGETRDDDRICTLNRDTHVIEYQRPTRRITQYHKGRMYSLEGRRISLCTTPEHELYVRGRRGAYELVSAKDCFGKVKVHLRTGEWQGETRERIEIGPHVFDMDAFLRFFGFWIADGSISRARRGPVYLGQRREVNPEIYQEMVEAIEGLDLDVHVGQYKDSICFSDGALWDWLVQFGKAREKFIPRELLELNGRQLEILVDQLFKTDGMIYRDERHSHTRTELFTSSSRLADDYQELALKIGLSANIRKPDKSAPEQHVVRLSFKRETWINSDNRYRREKWIEYDGPVHCVEVPNHVIYVRRNGIPVWCGNCTLILPDSEMPHDKAGSPLEVLMNPIGTPGRMNVGQVLENAAGKIAKKRGETFKVENFSSDDNLRDTVEALRKEGLSDKEDLIDPTTGRTVPGIQTGEQYILKMEHQVGKKMAARDRDAYDHNLIPRGGGKHGAQAMGTLGNYAMLAHGSHANLREMQTIKCFTWSTPVITEDGVMPIGKIVNQRLNVQVLSYNTTTRELEYKPILNFWKRGMDDTPLVELTVHSPAPSGVFKRRRIHCTHEHEIYDETMEKVFARDMVGREALVPALSPTVAQRDVLIGSLLGDGCLQMHNGPFPCFQERHSIRQSGYLEFKSGLLSGFSRRGVRQYTAGETGFNCGQEMCEFRTLAQPAFSELHDMFYRSGKRVVPLDIEELLTPLSVAVWYQDDGSLVYGNRQRVLRLHVGVLTETDRLLLIDALKKKVGVTFTEVKQEVQYNGRLSVQWSLRLGKSEEINRFLEYVRPYVHPSMSYKVGGSCGQALVDLPTAESTRLFATKVLAVRPFKPNVWEGRFLYNLEVEGNHNYFAGGLLVGNSDKAQGGEKDELWGAIQAGELLPPPKTTFAYEKFNGYLKAMGVDTKKDGNSLQLLPLTDENVLSMSSGEIKDGGRILKMKTLAPEKNGLFDEKATGGMDGKKWSHIKLSKPMPNPLFEKAIMSLTGIRSPQFARIIDGEDGVTADGAIVSGKGGEGAVYGPQAVGHLLEKVDVKADLVAEEERIKGLRGQAQSEARRKVKYLRALNRLGMAPTEAYMSKYVPVLPPSMRPISIMEDGSLQTDDMNELYKGLAIVNKKHQEFPNGTPESLKAPVSASIYDHMKALTGVGGTLNAKHPGVLDVLAGKEGPKTGFVQGVLLKRKQDLTARSTIVPEPSLSLDQVALPRKAAKEMYKPFIVSELRRATGATPLAAKKMIDSDDPLAKKALERVVEERPVLLKRDPALHKYSIQAFKPQLVEGKAIKIHPLVCSGFNADFDGDQQVGAVIVSIPQNVYNASYKTYKSKEISLTARFRETVHYENVWGSTVVCDLSEFPHLEEKVTNGHIDYHPVPAGVRVVAMDENGGLVWAEVAGWSRHRQRKVEIVTLGSGKQIITDDDERAVYGLDASSLEWCRRRPSEAQDQFVPVSQHEPLCDPNDRFYGAALPDDPSGRLRERSTAGFDFGYFIGATAGDGWSGYREGKPSTVNLASNIDELVSRWKSSCLSVFEHPPTFTHAWTVDGKLGESGGSGRVTVSCAPLARVVLYWIGHGAENKHLPAFYHRGDRSFLIGLLSGLWDTDGSASYSNAKKRPQFMFNYSTTSLRLAYEIQHLLRMLQVTATITATKTPKGGAAWVLSASIVELHDAKLELDLAHPTKRELYNQFLCGERPDSTMAYSRNRLVPVPSALARELRKLVDHKRHKSLYTILSTTIKRQYLSKGSAVDLIGLLEQQGSQCRHPLFEKWKQIVLLPNCYFERVKSIEVTEIKEDGYDLTVPGYETFMNTTGVILSNTMSAYVPVGQEAVKEARRMFPSNNLFSPATHEVMYTPSHEQQVGLYMASQVGEQTNKSFKNAAELEKAFNSKEVGLTDVVRVGSNKTTLGRVRIDSNLPEGLRGGMVLTDLKHTLTKKEQGKLFQLMAEKDAEGYSEAVDRLKDIGNKTASTEGFSFGLEDFKVHKDVRDPALRYAEMKTAKLDPSSPKDVQKIVDVYGEALEKIEAGVKEKAKKGKSQLDRLQTAAGIKGNGYRQLTAAPVLFVDGKGEVVPNPVKRSYSEGLTSTDYWSSTSGGRKGIVQKVQSVSEPGYLTKMMTNSTIDTVVDTEDCETDRGISLSIDEPDVVGRVTAVDLKLGKNKTIPAGTLLTPELVTKAKNVAKNWKVVVRSPMRCNHPKGVCKKCMGLNENGQFHDKGTNVGVMAAQALGERGTQLAMKSFHSGGVYEGKGAGKSLTSQGLERATSILYLKQKVKGSATLATSGGRIKRIKKDPAGGARVTVEDQEIYVPADRKLLPKMKIGASVRQGDALTSGPINPHELLPLTNMSRVQGHMAGELHDLYGQYGIRRRNSEVMVRALSNVTKVEDPGDHPDLLPGDFASTTQVYDWNKKNSKGASVKHAPVLRGVKQIPLDVQEDWMARLNHEHLRSTLIEGSQQNWSSDLHGVNPIPPLIHGVEFGKGTEKEPWRY
jgi:DNA-directed RNA polymerase beta subunit/DNA-directed RNA polymerase beta' subunit/intein/homing endonuclease